MATLTHQHQGTRQGLGHRLLAAVTAEPLLRLARAVVVSFTVMVIAFGLIRFIPGDPAAIMLGELATPEAVAELRAQLGLNGTLPEQFVRYVARFVQGDLGISLATHQPVILVIQRTLPVTLWYILVVVVMSLVVAIPLGLLAAIYRRTRFNGIFRTVSSLLLAMPVFYSGLVLILIFSIQLKLAPVAGYVPDFPQNLRYLWLPALTNATLLVPILARVLQSSIIDTMEEEFVETAIVRGLPQRLFAWRYLLRPSLAPTVSLLAYVVGQLLGSAVIIEIIFGLPGVGSTLIEAVRVRDYPLVQGIVAVFGLIVVIVGYLSDVVSRWIDPRVKRKLEA